MSKNAQKIGWIGAGRMGTPMAERLLKAGHDVTIWNRTRAKAEPLAAKGGKLVDKPAELAGCDVVFAIVSTGKDVEEVYSAKTACSAAAQEAEDVGRLLVDLGRGVRRHPQAPEGKGRELHRRAGVRQRQGDQGRQAVVGGVRSGSRRQDRDAADRGVRAAGRVLCRRRRTRAHLQDRAQRHARRRDREPDRDHAARQQDGRAAPRLPRLHEQRRHGLDVHRATRRRRWSISTGPRPSRPNCCARTSISASSSAANGTCRCR